MSSIRIRAVSNSLNPAPCHDCALSGRDNIDWLRGNDNPRQFMPSTSHYLYYDGPNCFPMCAICANRNAFLALLLGDNVQFNGDELDFMIPIPVAKHSDS